MTQVSPREAREVEAFEQQRQRRIRRTAPVTQLILIVLLVAVGVTTVIDMRRLQTPGGTALSWVEAATFGDCERYGDLSVLPEGVLERRTPTQVCDTLRARTQDDRERQASIGIRLDDSGPGRALITVTRDGRPVQSELTLVRDGRWRVVLDGRACNPFGCA